MPRPARHGLLRYAFCVVCMCAGLALTACSGSESNVERGNREGVLYYGSGSEVQTLDPHIVSDTTAADIVGTMFEGLVRHHPETLQPEPGMATHWVFSDDRRTITFYINPEARWTNGDPVTAHDFVWSWQRSLNPKMGNVLAEYLFPLKNAFDYHRGLIADPAAIGARALDDLTLEVSLEHPNPQILIMLDTAAAFPVHRATIESHGSWTSRFTGWTRPENMVSNGPFTLSDWQIYRQLEVRRSDTYWDRANVKLNGILFKPVDNLVTEEKMFRAGQLHITQRVPINRIPAYTALEQSPYIKAPLLGSYYYILNIDREPLTDPRVRRALAYAVDRKKLTDAVLSGTELPSWSFTPRGIAGYEPPEIAPYDPPLARKLLAEAGYPDGANWPGLELYFNTDENHRRIAVALQQMWKDALNIRVTLENMEWKVYLDKVDGRDFQMARMGWIGAYPDPAIFLNKFVTDGGTNRTGFSDARYDEIMQELVPRAGSLEERFALMHEAEQRFLAQMPVIPLLSYTGKHLVQPSVSGYFPNILEYRNFKYLALDPDLGPWRWPEEN